MEPGSTGGDIRDMHSGQDIRDTEDMQGTGKAQDTAPSSATGKQKPEPLRQRKIHAYVGPVPGYDHHSSGGCNKHHTMGGRVGRA